MIHFILGKPRNGKGLHLMRKIIWWLRFTRFPVMTNFALKMEPWVNATGKPQMGLLAYLTKTYGDTFDAENRVKVLDEDQTRKFFTYRMMWNRDTSKYEFTEGKYSARPTKNGGEVIDSFETDLLCNSRPHFIGIDEADAFWPARDWQQTGNGVTFYTKQHGKAGDETYFCTQHTKLIDPNFYRLAQDFLLCVARGFLKIGYFRRPDDYKVYVFENAPTGSKQDAMTVEKHKLDVEGIAQCYDTRGGVGIRPKNMFGDYGAQLKQTGMPFWALLGAACLIPILAWFLISHVLLWATKKAVPKVDIKTPTSQVVPSEQPMSRSVANYFMPQINSNRVVLPSEQGELLRSNFPVMMSGFCKLDKLTVFLTDGNSYTPGDGHLQFLCHNYCVVDGVTNWMLKAPVGRFNPDWWREGGNQTPAVVYPDVRVSTLYHYGSESLKSQYPITGNYRVSAPNGAGRGF